MAFGIPDMSRGGNELYDRLLSPDEFYELPGGVRMEFPSYMSYVNNFQKTKRRNQDAMRVGSGTQGMDFSRDGGTLRVGQGGTSLGTGAGGMIKIGGGSKYRTHTGIGGIPRLEARGGRTEIGGDYIPTSLEELKSSEELNYAIPKIQEEAELGYLTPKAARINKEWEAAYPKRQEAQEKRGQEQQKIAQRDTALDIAQQRADQSNERFYNGLKSKEDLARLNGDIRKGLLERQYALKGIDNSQKSELQSIRDYLLGNVPGSEQAIAKNMEYAERAMTIANNAFNNSVKMEDKKEAAQAQRDILNHISRLKLLRVSPAILGDTARGRITEAITEAEGTLKQPLMNQAQPQRVTVRNKVTGAYEYGTQLPDGSVELPDGSIIPMNRGGRSQSAPPGDGSQFQKPAKPIDHNPRVISSTPPEGVQENTVGNTVNVMLKGKWMSIRAEDLEDALREGATTVSRAGKMASKMKQIYSTRLGRYISVPEIEEDEWTEMIG